MSIAPETKVGPYEILSHLAVGGMGEVYRARDTRLGRDVAIKFLPLIFSQSPQRMRRFQQEARATGMLNHPNILAVYDIGTYNEQPYLVTELLEGETLRQRIDERGVPPSKALDYAQQIARGLAAAHEKGITHRDLKPDNLFLTYAGTVKILDFGLAKMSPLQPDEGYDEEATVVGTESGLLLGTVGYMAPEQAMAKPVDHRADIFSLGVILYEMLSGQRAFQAETTVETMTLIIRGDPPALNIPAPLDSLLRRCLEKSPAERFQSVGDLGFALQAIALEGSVSAAAIVTPLPASARARWRGRVPRLALLAALAVIAILSVTLGVVVWRGRTRPLPVYAQMTYDRGVVYSARFAPDGHSVIYSAQWRGRPIEVLSVERAYPESRSLVSPGIVLAVSAAGQMALLQNPSYVWHAQWKGTLAEAPIAGGAPRDLRENALEADYGPNGQLAVVTQDTGGGKYRLEYPLGKVIYESSGWLSNPRVSPTGDRVAFLEHPSPSDSMGIVSMVDRAGTKTDISPRWPGTLGLAWNPRGDEVWFSAADTGPAYIVRASDTRGHVRDVLSGAGGLVLQDIAADGRLLIIRSASRSEVRVLIDGAKERDLSWLDNSVPTDLSRDGKLLLFTEGSPAIGSLYATCMRKTDGSPVTRLGDGFSASFSPDGKWTVSFLPTSPGQMLLLPIGAGQPRTLERGAIESYGYTAGWFPDNARILLGANEAGKPLRTYVQNINGGPPKPILKDGLLLPRPVAISPDGKQVVCHGADHKWMLCSLTSDETKPLPTLAVTEEPAQWTPDGKYLYIFDPHVMPLHIVKLDVTTGQRQPWRDLVPSDLAGVHGSIFLAITPDGKSVTYSTGREFSDLFTVDGVK